MRTIIGRTIDFRAGGDAVAYQAGGWSMPEPGFTWTSGPRSALTLDSPDSPHGFFIEADCFPHLAPPWLDAQPLTVRVNGARVFTGDVRADEVIAIRCPPPERGERKMIISFEHPNAARPRDLGMSADYRLLAIAFRRLRILPLIEPAPAQLHRVSHLRLAARAVEDLAAEAEALAGLPTADLLSGFEMLSGNCDMGLMQRQFGSEPLSLLRFAGAFPSASIRGLDTGFEGLGQSLEPWEAYGEWMVRDLNYGLNYHTGQRAAGVTAEKLLTMERTRIGFLLRKLAEDLETGEKMFVADRVSPSLAGVLPVFLALCRHGPRRMLWVTMALQDNDGGAVREILPGLFMARLNILAEPMWKYVTLRGWLEVMVNASIVARAADAA